jgi:hypothetical protein
MVATAVQRNVDSEDQLSHLIVLTPFLSTIADGECAVCALDRLSYSCRTPFTNHLVFNGLNPTLL